MFSSSVDNYTRQVPMDPLESKSPVPSHCSEESERNLDPAISPPFFESNNKTQKLYKSIENHAKDYKTSICLLDDINIFFTRLLLIYECVILNKKNILYSTCFFCPRHQEQIDQILSFLNENFLWAKTVPFFLLSCIEQAIVHLCYLPRYKGFSPTVNKFNSSCQDPSQLICNFSGKNTKASLNFKKVRKILHDFDEDIQDDLKKSKDIIIIKSFKLGAQISIIALCGLGITQNTATALSKCIFDSFRHLFSYSQIHQNLTLQDKWIQAIEKQKIKHQDFQTTTTNLESHKNVDKIIYTLCVALLEKHTIERKFLLLRIIQDIADFCCSSLSVAFTLPRESFHNYKFLSYFRLHRMPWIHVIYVFYPLCPKITLKIGQLVILFAGHFFSTFYKPHEYSLKGYRISINIRVVELTQNVKQISYFVLENTLWITSWHAKKSAETFYTKVITRRQASLKQSQDRINDLYNSYKQLQIQDCKYILNLSFEQITQEILEQCKSNNNNKDFEILQEFFSRHIGLELSRDATQNDIQRHLEELFCLAENKFIQTYDTQDDVSESPSPFFPSLASGRISEIAAL